MVSLAVFFPAIWHPFINRSEGGGYESSNVCECLHVIWHIGSLLPTPYLSYASRCSMRNILVLCEIFLFSVKDFCLSVLWNTYVHGSSNGHENKRFWMMKKWRNLSTKKWDLRRFWQPYIIWFFQISLCFFLINFQLSGQFLHSSDIFSFADQKSWSVDGMLLLTEMQSAPC